MARLIALAAAIVLNMVFGFSYYSMWAQSAPTPELSKWLFIASVVTLLRDVQVVPECVRNNLTSYLLAMETSICCLTLDLLLLVIWLRIENICHSAILGVLHSFCMKKTTFEMYEYWLLALLTSVIGLCMLCLTIWATGLSEKLHDRYIILRGHVEQLYKEGLEYMRSITGWSRTRTVEIQTDPDPESENENEDERMFEAEEPADFEVHSKSESSENLINSKPPSGM